MNQLGDSIVVAKGGRGGMGAVVLLETRGGRTSAGRGSPRALLSFDAFDALNRPSGFRQVPLFVGPLK